MTSHWMGRHGRPYLGPTSLYAFLHDPSERAHTTLLLSLQLQAEEEWQDPAGLITHSSRLAQAQEPQSCVRGWRKDDMRETDICLRRARHRKGADNSERLGGGGGGAKAGADPGLPTFRPSSERYVFRHYEDVSQYSAQYRYYHTVANTGRTGVQLLPEAETQEMKPDWLAAGGRPKTVTYAHDHKLPRIKTASVLGMTTSASMTSSAPMKSSAPIRASAFLRTSVGCVPSMFSSLHCPSFSSQVTSHQVLRDTSTSRPMTSVFTLSRALSKERVLLTREQFEQFCLLRAREVDAWAARADNRGQKLFSPTDTKHHHGLSHLGQDHLCVADNETVASSAKQRIAAVERDSTRVRSLKKKQPLDGDGGDQNMLTSDRSTGSGDESHVNLDSELSSQQVYRQDSKIFKDSLQQTQVTREKFLKADLGDLERRHSDVEPESVKTFKTADEKKRTEMESSTYVRAVDESKEMEPENITVRAADERKETEVAKSKSIRAADAEKHKELQRGNTVRTADEKKQTDLESNIPVRAADDEKHKELEVNKTIRATDERKQIKPESIKTIGATDLTKTTKINVGCKDSSLGNNQDQIHDAHTKDASSSKAQTPTTLPLVLKNSSEQRKTLETPGTTNEEEKEKDKLMETNQIDEDTGVHSRKPQSASHPSYATDTDELSKTKKTVDETRTKTKQTVPQKGQREPGACQSLFRDVTTESLLLAMPTLDTQWRACHCPYQHAKLHGEGIFSRCPHPSISFIIRHDTVERLSDLKTSLPYHGGNPLLKTSVKGSPKIKGVTEGKAQTAQTNSKKTDGVRVLDTIKVGARARISTKKGSSGKGSKTAGTSELHYQAGSAFLIHPTLMLKLKNKLSPLSKATVRSPFELTRHNEKLFTAAPKETSQDPRFAAKETSQDPYSHSDEVSLYPQNCTWSQEVHKLPQKKSLQSSHKELDHRTASYKNPTTEIQSDQNPQSHIHPSFSHSSDKTQCGLFDKAAAYFIDRTSHDLENRNNLASCPPNCGELISATGSTSGQRKAEDGEFLDGTLSKRQCLVTASRDFETGKRNDMDRNKRQETSQIPIQTCMNKAFSRDRVKDGTDGDTEDEGMGTEDRTRCCPIPPASHRREWSLNAVVGHRPVSTIQDTSHQQHVQLNEDNTGKANTVVNQPDVIPQNGERQHQIHVKTAVGETAKNRLESCHWLQTKRGVEVVSKGLMRPELNASEVTNLTSLEEQHCTKLGKLNKHQTSGPERCNSNHNSTRQSKQNVNDNRVTETVPEAYDSKEHRAGESLLPAKFRASDQNNVSSNSLTVQKEFVRSGTTAGLNASSEKLQHDVSFSGGKSSVALTCGETLNGGGLLAKAPSETDQSHPLEEGTLDEGGKKHESTIKEMTAGNFVPQKCFSAKGFTFQDRGKNEEQSKSSENEYRHVDLLRERENRRRLDVKREVGQTSTPKTNVKVKGIAGSTPVKALKTEEAQPSSQNPQKRSCKRSMVISKAPSTRTLGEVGKQKSGSTKSLQLAEVKLKDSLSDTVQHLLAQTNPLLWTGASKPLASNLPASASGDRSQTPLTSIQRKREVCLRLRSSLSRPSSVKTAIANSTDNSNSNNTCTPGTTSDPLYRKHSSHAIGDSCSYKSPVLLCKSAGVHRAETDLQRGFVSAQMSQLSPTADRSLLMRNACSARELLQRLPYVVRQSASGTASPKSPRQASKCATFSQGQVLCDRDSSVSDVRLPQKPDNTIGHFSNDCPASFDLSSQKVVNATTCSCHHNASPFKTGVCLWDDDFCSGSIDDSKSESDTGRQNKDFCTDQERGNKDADCRQETTRQEYGKAKSSAVVNNTDDDCLHRTVEPSIQGPNNFQDNETDLFKGQMPESHEKSVDIPLNSPFGKSARRNICDGLLDETAKQEDCKAKQEECKAKQEECKAKQQECKAKQEGCKVNLGECKTKQESKVKVKQEACWAKQDQCKVKQEACRVKQDDCKVKKQECKVKQEECRAKQECKVSVKQERKVRQEDCTVKVKRREETIFHQELGKVALEKERTSNELRFVHEHNTRHNICDSKLKLKRVDHKAFEDGCVVKDSLAPIPRQQRRPTHSLHRERTSETGADCRLLSETLKWRQKAVDSTTDPADTQQNQRGGLRITDNEKVPSKHNSRLTCTQKEDTRQRNRHTNRSKKSLGTSDFSSSFWQRSPADIRQLNKGQHTDRCVRHPCTSLQLDFSVLRTSTEDCWLEMFHYKPSVNADSHVDPDGDHRQNSVAEGCSPEHTSDAGCDGDL